ncbi:hypothetical protein LC55x_5216 [Lysobacter capsici]|nr:hypothetical protein LC55x_5216 [Lysobacter capsici]
MAPIASVANFARFVPAAAATSRRRGPAPRSYKLPRRAGLPSAT